MAEATHEHEQRARIADLIRLHAAEIEQRWLTRVKAELGTVPVSPSELRNSMPEYLMRLADGLSEVGTVQAGGTKSWENVARNHAEMRVRLGFDIDQLVHEFIVLRQVLFRVIEEHVGVLVELHLSERLADLIDGAISAAVKSYVASRDYDARRREAEHIGFITHELRNPLATALLGAQRLQRGGDIRAKEQRTLQLMERNLLRISELIDAVLVMERHTHSFKPTISTTTLGDLIEEVVENGRLAAESKGLSFVSHFDANIAVNVDAKLAHSAIDNVIQNAVKYTDSGEVRVTADDGPKEVVIHVCDHCSGIPPQEMAMLFEPFRRASHKPGTGLGLAIAKRALEVQGGAIGVEPAQDGCHFWVKLRKPTH